MYYSISGVKYCIFWRDAVVTVGSGQMSLVHTSEKYGITDTEITTTCIFLLIVLSMNDWSTFFLYCVSWRRVACLVCWLLLAVCHCLSMGALYISLCHILAAVVATWWLIDLVLGLLTQTRSWMDSFHFLAFWFLSKRIKQEPVCSIIL